MRTLFEPYNLAGLRLPNRIVMAPMTRSRVEPGDVFGPLNATYYAQRSGAGLIISEAMVVEPEGRGYLDTPGLYSEPQVQGCREVVQAVHAAGGHMFGQLWHVGRVSHTSVLPEGKVPLGPMNEVVSDLYVFGITESGEAGRVQVSPCRAMTDAEVETTISCFASAAENAVRAGFEGVELLAANGYIFDQFLSSTINARSGRFAGSQATTRAAIVLQTVDAIRNRIGSSVRIGVRLSPFGRFNKMPPDPATEETFLFLAEEFELRNVTYVHFNDEPVSVGHLNDEAVLNTTSDGASDAECQRLIPKAFLREFRRRYRGTIMLCGGITVEYASGMLDEGIADLFAFGLNFIANPDLPRRLQDGIALAEPRTELFYGGGAEGFTDYLPAGEDGQPACGQSWAGAFSATRSAGAT